ncbi:hypothetical protein CDV36_013081 [Fusarium kuroshium]|uniref:Uncharacterized protein n=4 Tax=Fusarium solani species complex TaxID=232080 RepID=A0A3M2RPQ7_9HYPO|nr:hypothetical protein CDV36_013081 [Fusarium kuroshium]RSL47310.1 hypothetical protein CEP51_015792 [Fusarium floridanum]RSL81996.1 hypothetical protein CEP52_017066 [Fusarium oligoseptatum]RSM17416.1 hypothetical protein CDV31_003665 [Fusarium ambrosium]
MRGIDCTSLLHVARNLKLHPRSADPLHLALPVCCTCCLCNQNSIKFWVTTPSVVTIAARTGALVAFPCGLLCPSATFPED